MKMHYGKKAVAGLSAGLISKTGRYIIDNYWGPYDLTPLTGSVLNSGRGIVIEAERQIKYSTSGSDIHGIIIDSPDYYQYIDIENKLKKYQVLVSEAFVIVEVGEDIIAGDRLVSGANGIFTKSATGGLVAHTNSYEADNIKVVEVLFVPIYSTV